jgi:hypothetical protein
MWQQNRSCSQVVTTEPNSSFRTTSHFVNYDWRAALPSQDFETVLLGLEHHLPRDQLIDSVAIKITKGEHIVVGGACLHAAYVPDKVKWLQHPIDLRKQTPRLIPHLIGIGLSRIDPPVDRPDMFSFPWCPQCGVKILHERDREVLFYVQSQVADVLRGSVFRNLRTSQDVHNILGNHLVRGIGARVSRRHIPYSTRNRCQFDRCRCCQVVHHARSAAGSLRGVRGKRTFFGGIDLIAFLKLQPPVQDFGCELGRQFLGERVKSDVLPALGMSTNRQGNCCCERELKEACTHR